MSAKALRLSSSHMKGPVVKGFQDDLNGVLQGWGVHHRVKVDGDYGQATRDTAESVCYGLGIAQAQLAHGVTPAVRVKIRHPGRRSKVEIKRAAGRVDWRGRYRKRYAHASHGPDAAVAYLAKFVGMTEHPAGSNHGPTIDKWAELAGYGNGGVAWCGICANAGLVAGGLPSQTWGIGYCPSIEARARAGVGGWKWHSANATPKRGWLALFTESGIAGHVETVEHDGHPLRTIGGNTSLTNGSPSNGGAVARHNFAVYHGLPLRGFAEPPY